jgi:hypothetical protein
MSAATSRGRECQALCQCHDLGAALAAMAAGVHSTFAPQNNHEQLEIHGHAGGQALLLDEASQGNPFPPGWGAMPH